MSRPSLYAYIRPTILTIALKNKLILLILIWTHLNIVQLQYQMITHDTFACTENGIRFKYEEYLPPNFITVDLIPYCKGPMR